MHYFVEALIVGLLSAVLGLIVSTGMMYINNPEFDLKEYGFWPYVFLGYFVTGVLMHLLFQWTGGNAWYCKHGDACLPEDLEY